MPHSNSYSVHTLLLNVVCGVVKNNNKNLLDVWTSQGLISNNNSHWHNKKGGHSSSHSNTPTPPYYPSPLLTPTHFHLEKAHMELSMVLICDVPHPISWYYPTTNSWYQHKVISTDICGCRSNIMVVCMVPLDVPSYKQAALLAVSHHWRHSVETHTLLQCGLMTECSTDEYGKLWIFIIQLYQEIWCDY